MKTYAVLDRLSTRHKWQFVVNTLSEEHARRVFEIQTDKAKKFFEYKRPGKYPTAQVCFTTLNMSEDNPLYDPLPASYKPAEVVTVGF